LEAVFEDREIGFHSATDILNSQRKMATVLGKVISRGIATTRVASGQAAVSGHQGILFWYKFIYSCPKLSIKNLLSCCGHVHPPSLG
jgi:hypothetical protein